MKMNLIKTQLNLLIVLLFTSLNSYAQTYNDCRDIYRSKLSVVTDGAKIGLSVGGAAAGAGAYLALVPAATLWPVPFYVAGAALAWGGKYVVDEIHDRNILNMIQLIDDAYAYRNNETVGKNLGLYFNGLKNKPTDFSLKTLSENLIRSNEDFSLCSMFGNYHQLKKAQAMDPKVTCKIRLPEVRGESSLNSFQREYGRYGIVFTQNESASVDFEIKLMEETTQESLNSTHNRVTEHYTYELSQNNKVIKEVFSKDFSYKIRKDEQVQFFNRRYGSYGNISVLKDLVQETFQMCPISLPNTM